MAPMFEPLLNRPEAKARSFWEKSSVIALIAAGKAPLSPTPKAPRASMNWLILPAPAVAICVTVQIEKASARPIFAPIRSTIRPHSR